MESCLFCQQLHPAAALELHPYGYACRKCTAERALAELPDPARTGVKVGRGRWWIAPLVVVAIAVLCYLAPAYMFIGAGLVLIVLARFWLRGGIR